jgi:hypothetical protein
VDFAGLFSFVDRSCHWMDVGLLKEKKGRITFLASRAQGSRFVWLPRFILQCWLQVRYVRRLWRSENLPRQFRRVLAKEFPKLSLRMVRQRSLKLI